MIDSLHKLYEEINKNYVQVEIGIIGAASNRSFYDCGDGVGCLRCTVLVLLATKLKDLFFGVVPIIYFIFLSPVLALIRFDNNKLCHS